MKENKYDDPQFFEKYSQMPRSRLGLEGAGEWHALKPLLPDFAGKRVLDLGCGFGWHCIYAAAQGARAVTGIDVSENMLMKARAMTDAPQVAYRRVAIEDYEYPEDQFDIAISSLALHYIASFGDVCAHVRRCLVDGGTFIFSVEHPVFTARARQEWVLDGDGTPLHWPVDGYFSEGARSARFLDEDVIKVHRTLTTYVGELIGHGFEITALCEPTPPDAMLGIPGMADELRRPMMLILRAKNRKYDEERRA